MSEPATLPEMHLSREPSPTRPLTVRTFGITDPGRVRSSNEDQFLVAELTKAMKVQYASLHQPNTQCADERGYLFIVADGMGGHQAGEQAMLWRCNPLKPSPSTRSNGSSGSRALKSKTY